MKQGYSATIIDLVATHTKVFELKLDDKWSPSGDNDTDVNYVKSVLANDKGWGGFLDNLFIVIYSSHGGKVQIS